MIPAGASERPVLILGAGYAGLAAAHRLGRHGVRSTILEAEAEPGGLARCTSVDGLLIERFYHHIKPEDIHIIQLIDEMGLSDRLHWSDTRMGFYSRSRFHPFSTPLDLLGFSPLPFADRLRFALGVFKAKRTDGKTLEGMNAEEWVIQEWGQTIYRRIMRPMLLNKFGIPPARISAGFLQGRIKGLSSSKSSVKGGERLAHLTGSLHRLTDRLRETIREHSEIRLRTPAERIEADRGLTVWSGDRQFSGRYVINTLPLTIFAKISKNFPFETEVDYQGVVCAIFVVEEPLTPLYWVNVLDEDITFRILVNQSRINDYPHTVVYCGNYLRPDETLFGKSDGEILSLYAESLRSMFGSITVRDAKVSRTKFATPVFEKDFASKTADLDASIPGMVFAGNVHIYPYSRTVSSVIGTGYAAADRVLSWMRGPHAPRPTPKIT